MRILIAPNTFKGSCSAIDAANAIEKGILNVMPDARTEKIPLSDGGDGFLDTVKFISPELKIYRAKVVGPLGKETMACYGVMKRVGVIEMAQASGLRLLSAAEMDPLLATTYGTGQLIRSALDKGVKKIILGIGGSATVDGGIGCLQALGVKFYKKDHSEIGFGGKELINILNINLSGLNVRIRGIEFIIVCDVQNRLFGSKGAAYMYGPQKGADARMVKILDKGLRNYAGIIKKDIGVSIKNIRGAGAAGGIGAGLKAIAGAELKAGMDIVSDMAGLESKAGKADLVITGEGKIDSQTVYGKAPIGIAKIAKKYRVPVIAICGSIGSGYETVYRYGINAVISITDSPIDISSAMKNSEFFIEKAAERLSRILLIGQRMKKH